MAQYEVALGALNPFRVELQTAVFRDIERQRQVGSVAAAQSAAGFSTGGASSALVTPLTNVHATGVGVRVRKGKIVPDEFVIKVYVYEKLDLGDKAPALTTVFQGIDIDVEALPVQLAAGRRAQRVGRAQDAPAPVVANRGRIRPIQGGVSISPLNARYVGTLGCFVRGVSAGTEQLFALSNNHVLADVNTLPTGTVIVQPGPETKPTDPADGFAVLSNFIPVQFPERRFERVLNHFDAAIARVTDRSLIQLGSILGVPNYDPTLAAATPGMRVTKSGRTTGVTSGTVTATHVNSVQINYGNAANPRIAVYDDTIQVTGDDGMAFSLPGDSGSAILEADTGRPVALLFAGDGRTTTACDIGGVCRQFQVIPA